MELSTSSSEDEGRSRSRSTFYRRFGPKTKRRRRNNPAVPGPGQADTELPVIPDACAWQEQELNQGSDGTSESECGDWSSDSDSCPSDLDVNFLDEEGDAPEPNVQVGLDAAHQEPAYDYDEQPHIMGSGSESDGEEEGDDDYDGDEDDLDNSDEGGGPFTFDDASLNAVLEMREQCIVREALLLDLALSVRHKLTYETLIGSFINKNTMFGGKFFPTSKKELWRVLHRTSAGIQKHIYCRNCGSYVAKYQDLGDIATCRERGCEFQVSTSKAPYFIELDLRTQITQFFQTPGAAEILSWREKRKKKCEDAYEDIMDGDVYYSLQAQGFALPGSYQYTGIFNTDGCKKSMGARTHIYTIFYRLNEIPVQLRQKFMFLAGVYVDRAEPKMLSFFKPFASQINRLSSRGVEWTPIPGGPQVVSKIFTIGFCVDDKARWQILNMCSHNSHFGCTYCDIQGVTVEGKPTMRWLANPAWTERTDAGMKRDMLASVGRQPVRGHKGVTPLLLCKYLDLRKGNAVDDLHNLYECAAPHTTELMLKEARRVDRNMGLEVLCLIVDSRLKKFKTPTRISRKPGTCSISNRGLMTGTEFRNWTLYYGLPCLKGLIEDVDLRLFQYLSQASYLLSLDSITDDNLQEAGDCIRTFLTINEEKYGIERTKLNLHSMEHFVSSTQNLGNIWNYSTFNFESWNHKVLQTVSSPKGMLLQIVTRHLIYLSLLSCVHVNENLSDIVKIRLQELINSKRIKRAIKVEDNTYVLGKAQVRVPSEEEMGVLALEGYENATIMKTYKKVQIRGCKYTVQNLDVNSKSEDCMVFTHSDTYCTILNIVVLLLEDREVFGMFVLEHDVRPDPAFEIAKHISTLLPGNFDILHFCHSKDVRSRVVRMHMLDCTYVCPLPNHFEID